MDVQMPIIELCYTVEIRDEKKFMGAIWRWVYMTEKLFPLSCTKPICFFFTIILLPNGCYTPLKEL